MRDPRRLREGGDDPIVVDLLEAARAYTRPRASRNRILRTLGLPAAISVGIPAAAVASSLGAKVVLVVSTVTLLAAGGGAIAYRAQVRAQAHERASSTSHRVVAARDAQPRPAIAHAAEASPPATIVEQPPLAGVVSPTVAGPAREHPAAASSRKLWAGHRLRLAVSEPAVAPALSPTPGSPEQSTAPPPVSFAAPPAMPSRPSPVPAAPAATAEPRRAPLAREIALLDAAERAERKQEHGVALGHLETYRREFPDGALTAEAEVLRISALFGAGETATARAHARAFLDHSRPSPLTTRVASLLSRASGQSDTKEQP